MFICQLILRLLSLTCWFYTGVILLYTLLLVLTVTLHFLLIFTPESRYFIRLDLPFLVFTFCLGTNLTDIVTCKTTSTVTCTDTLLLHNSIVSSIFKHNTITLHLLPRHRYWRTYLHLKSTTCNKKVIAALKHNFYLLLRVLPIIVLLNYTPWYWLYCHFTYHKPSTLYYYVFL